MTRTGKLLAELIALPSVNPAFVPPSPAASARQARHYGEKNVVDFLATVAKRAGLEVEFQKVFGVRGRVRALESGDVSPQSKTGSRVRSPHQTAADEIGRANLIVRLLPRNKIRQTILLAPHLDTINADDSQFVPRRKNLMSRRKCNRGTGLRPVE
jgi:acetylornithine deacetylase/succinyl-diaminopimelate desuccinylase-like protein